MVQDFGSRQRERFDKLLAIATIEPQLQSLLVFDGTEKDLLVAAHTWKKFLAIAHGSEVSMMTLDSVTTEEKLWGRFSLESDREKDGTKIEWKPSKLVATGGKPLLVVIPDLTRLSLVAIRACVMLLEHDWATVQREGVDRTWQPQFWCIARCPSDRLGEVSPHLLDRFSLRCRAVNLDDQINLSPLEYLLRLEQSAQSQLEDIQLLDGLQGLAERVQSIITAKYFPMMSDQAIARIQSYFEKKKPKGMRRLIVLGRLARGLAQLEDATEVSWEIVDRAAKILGLRQNLPLLKPSAPSPSPTKPREQGSQKVEPRFIDPVEASQPSEETEVVIERVVEPDQTDIFKPTVVEEEDLYLEDNAPLMRELEPLKIPISVGRSPRNNFGYPIGTQPATSLDDISILGTVFEAIKYQNYRRNSPRHQAKNFQIWLSDLRSYRRMPTPQYHLICAIDFTCLENRQWEDALVPHIRDWAYVNRASISIVRIGAKDVPEPLKAELVRSRNLLASNITDALKGEPGVATPLAHGLELAAQAARRALQHGRNHAIEARLVVLTDGRGNIPLQCSLEGNLDQPVFQEGIDDALAVAQTLAEIPRLEIALLNPQPIFYQELPHRLARALGAVVEDIEEIPSVSVTDIDSPDVSEEREPISLGEGWE